MNGLLFVGAGYPVLSQLVLFEAWAMLALAVGFSIFML
jgi:hypothetical protein